MRVDRHGLGSMSEGRAHLLFAPFFRPDRLERASSVRTAFWWVVGGALALRLFIAVFLVFTGDEAYYYFWGLNPAIAYYDHPAMIGWLLAPFAWAGNAEWWIRLPAVLLLAPVAWFVVLLARPAGATKAYLAGIAIALVPTELLNVIITTDTPLVFFALASIVAYQRALALGARLRTSVNAWHWVAGSLLGAAFMSKYFAVLLGLGYLGFVLCSPRRERVWLGFAAVLLACSPWVLFNVYGNYEHCWLNVLFNLSYRNSNVGFSWRLVANYLGILLITTSPILLWQLARASWPARTPATPRVQPASAPDATSGAALLRDPQRRLVLFCCVIPLCFFACLSTVKVIGLHWVFAFTPLVFVLAAYVLEPRALKLNIGYLAALSSAFLIAVAILWALPIETWSRSHLYDGLVLTVKPMEVFELLKPYRAQYAFATDGYSNSVTLSYQARRHHVWPASTPQQEARDDFLVFGPGSAHGRQQDYFDDFRRLDGANILIFRKTAPPPAEYAPFFKSVVYRSSMIRGVRYYLVLGNGFDFPKYRDTVLAGIERKFYTIPSWLPSGRCFFRNRYFGAGERSSGLPGVSDSCLLAGSGPTVDTFPARTGTNRPLL